MRRIASGWAVGLGLTALSIAPAGATTVEELTLEEVTRRADAVVRAVVADVDVGWGRHLDRPAIVTRVTLAREVALKGEPLGRLELFGGRLGADAMELVGQPELAPGDEVFLFVLAGDVACPFVGVWQGVYVVRDGRVTREGRPVVDVARGRAFLAEDAEPGMAPAAFAEDVTRLVAAAARPAAPRLEGEAPTRPGAAPAPRPEPAPGAGPAPAPARPVLRLPDGPARSGAAAGEVAR